MSESYSPDNIESKWQARWDADQLYRAQVDWSKPKHYALTMLPYPSGDLHIGHWFAMTPSDARARWMRMKGYNVLFPMGFDAFGLPAEQAAISRNIHPWTWTYANIERMRKQMKSMGAMFDWEREMVSCVPEYYKWTEWFFKTFLENDLAYRGEGMVNWSDALQTVLANEQVIDGKDERLGQPVVQKLMTQWFFRMTKYAEELLKYDGIDWPEPIKIMQTNWIGRSEGAFVSFGTKHDNTINVFTTRPDTLWGATFVVLSPEHALVDVITTDEQKDAIEAYKKKAADATEIERLSEDREKTGVFTGAYAINPVTSAPVPVWIADYVMVNYGTGAIMAVPAHDQRDFAFAKKYGLEIRVVIQPQDENDNPSSTLIVIGNMTQAYSGPGYMINSGIFTGTISNGEKGRKNPAISDVIDYLEENDIGEERVNYRLRDWLISRQRYWGSPIPVVYDEEGNITAVADQQLPVELPQDVEFMPTGRSPLTYHEPFLHTSDGKRRETDTMDTFMCSSWYFYRYLSPHETTAPFDAEEAAYWLPVDVYTGGAEHATMHLLYTRFFHKAMRDTGVFKDTEVARQRHGRTDNFDEPMLMLRNQGQVLGSERPGDYLLCYGRFMGEKLIADRVEVVELNAVPANFNGVVGELMKRVESTLFVGIGSTTTLVEVLPEAQIVIPGVSDHGNVNQLKHHLDIQRMSKSKGNVVNPDELVAKYGADVVRSYLMGNFDWLKGGPWNDEQITGVIRWLNDVWDIATNPIQHQQGDPQIERQVERRVHQTISDVDYGLEKFSFNTAIASLMKLRNTLKAALKANGIGRDTYQNAMNVMLRLIAPFAPHISEELWDKMGFGYSVHQQSWPEYDAEKAKEDAVPLVIMINGRPRGTVEVAADITQAEAESIALNSQHAIKALNGAAPMKVIYIAGKEPKVNIVTGK